jgi:succinate-semialdehyde dehydrogenase/glutarate-semialdehyde dehydrogenase
LDLSQPVMNPAIGMDANAQRTDFNRTLEVADEGFRICLKVSAFTGSKLMRSAANLLRDRADVIAPLLTKVQGELLPETNGEVLAGADAIDWLAEETRGTFGRAIPDRAESPASPAELIRCSQAGR